MDIYVGNLPYSATEEEVSDLFAEFGPSNGSRSSLIVKQANQKASHS